MAKLLRLLLLGLIGAAIVHIAVLLLVPLYSSKNAWSHLEALGEPYSFYMLSEKSGLVTDQDPLIEQAACRFDLTNGPIHITTKGNLPFWSLSVYAPNGDNLYSLNDNVSNDRQLDLIIADPLGIAALRAEGVQNDGRSVIIEQNVSEGAVVLRSFVPDASWREQVQSFFTQASCAPYEAS
ncbi:DUF1254 domain-containing protein [Brucella thiophenivorans]|uniref:DUF1254 domain-containing protein n=1 Tax=Brucella thiophenivorans TaxID=571255 RepID=A0A256FXG7_9HYPH|nr:hypothetical protein [Brucella thiophenivorans]OYR19535.1 hypothetical protein CEV31_1817 [Brucella thiophenivorans]